MPENDGPPAKAAGRSRNPGLLNAWMNPEGQPYPLDEEGFVEFPTAVIGFNALRARVKINIAKKHLTLRRIAELSYRGFSAIAEQRCEDFVQDVLTRITSTGVRVDSDSPLYTQVELPNGTKS